MKKVSRHQSSQELSSLTRVCISCQNHFWENETPRMLERNVVWNSMLGLTCRALPWEFGKHHWEKVSLSIVHLHLIPHALPHVTFNIHLSR